MAKIQRVAPYRHKRKMGVKDSAVADLDERVAELEMQHAGIDTKAMVQRLELMTAEQLAQTQQIAAQNALKLFNEMLEEAKKRLPHMKDEVFVTTMLSVWDKAGGKK